MSINEIGILLWGVVIGIALGWLAIATGVLLAKLEQKKQREKDKTKDVKHE